MVRALALVALAAFAACSVDRGIPNARLGCKDDSACPTGYKCQASAGRMVCCLGGNCSAPPGTGGSPGAGGEGGAGGSGGTTTGGVGGGTTGGAGGNATDGAGGSATGGAGGSPTDGAGGAGGSCTGSGCAIKLIDDGIEERDMSSDCAGTLCLIGGITP